MNGVVHIVAGENVRISGGAQSSLEVGLTTDPLFNGLIIRDAKTPATRPPGSLALYVADGLLRLVRQDNTEDVIVVNRDITATRIGPSNGVLFVVQHAWEADFLTP